MERNRKSQFMSLLENTAEVIVVFSYTLTLLHSEWPKFHRVLAILSAIRLLLNPIALRMAKLHSEQPKLRRVLAALSAIRLSYRPLYSKLL